MILQLTDKELEMILLWQEQNTLEDKKLRDKIAKYLGQKQVQATIKENRDNPNRPYLRG